MICLICRQAETIPALTSIPLGRGEIRILITHVPAYVCPGCGETYVEDAVAIRLLAGAEARSVVGKLDTVVDYEFL